MKRKLQPSPILRKPDALRMLGDKHASFFNKISKGLITPPVKVGIRASGWPQHELAAIAAARIAGEPEESLRTLVKELVSMRPSIYQSVRESLALAA